MCVASSFAKWQFMSGLEDDALSTFDVLLELKLEEEKIVNN